MAVITEEADKKLKDISLEIEKQYGIGFLETGTERNHACFPVQSVPSYSPAGIVQKTKSITARKIFEVCPEVKKALWGGEFRTRGYYTGTVGEHGDEETIAGYVRDQGRKPEEYEKTYENRQLDLFT
jgi:REP element-mobilizing transposase RayT